MKPRAECFFIYLTLHLFTVINAQQSSSIQTACNSASDCTSCMVAHKTCNWCIAKPSADGKGWSASDPRCDTYDSLIARKCSAEFIKNITTEEISRKATAVRDAVDSSQPAIQLSPQKLHLKLRPGEKVKRNITFRLAKDYPVDLYYLMDLSQSMKDDKVKVANLGIQLAEEMRKITKDVRLGFGSFVDKVLMPYVNTLPDRLVSPCSDCESPYSFKHRLVLTDNTSAFADKVDATQVSGNLDEPEGGFDALMQAIVCDSVIGWRANSRKMLIFSTDSPFHSAGDGKLGGVVEPNDGQCHMENNEYTWAGKQDYPSISQIAAKVEDKNMNVIFAVTEDQQGRYNALSEVISSSVTGKLANDSRNIVELVRGNYQKISSKVVMMIRRKAERNEYLNVKVRASCNNDGKFDDMAECDNLGPGGVVTFEVEMQATSCANAKGGQTTETFEVYPSGLSETLEITTEVDCACECGDTEESSDACNSVGTYQCGICECGDSRYGDVCQCDMSTLNTDTNDLDAPCKRPSNSTTPQQLCSGRGECVCGECEVCDCLPGSRDKTTCRRFTGKYCQCNPDNCPRNSKGICSNRGKCQCDEGTAVHTCQCEEGYTGNECECPISQDTCIDPTNPEEICNGQGPCVCGVCRCEKQEGPTGERYTGQFCEECSTCTSKCQTFKQCTQCFVYREKGWRQVNLDETYCEYDCFKGSVNYTMVSEMPQGSGVRQCAKFAGEDDCDVSYSYEYLPRTGYLVYVSDKTECPTEPKILEIILGVIGGIVFLGLVALLIWRLIATLHDRRDFAKFEKETKTAQWNSNENPIYEQATSTFKNPMYQGSMRKT
ncbi:integrin beta pat-3-like [Watersipora subatra]|uniref:integrin beta pat-3-like n=1 Tax=Watersipora subatra TaxID=2589382 RepID=UPI00355BF35F